MGTSYEHRIVDAMVRRAEALERGDDQEAASALVEAGRAVDGLRHRRGARVAELSEQILEAARRCEDEP